MRNLDRRLIALETASDPVAFKPWHQIIQHIGMTEEDAQAAYEAENGPIGDDDNIIWRVVV